MRIVSSMVWVEVKVELAERSPERTSSRMQEGMD